MIDGNSCMVEQSSKRLQYICDTIPALLDTINEEEFSYKPSPQQWSKKEILGHLIDSATNNHHRFIRVQFEQSPLITYNQNTWNRCGQYDKISSKQLVTFWASYNRYLVELIKCIPRDTLARECNIGRESNVTLEWLIEDYLRHLEHHVHQIIEYT
jgi:hypothetical protein